MVKNHLIFIAAFVALLTPRGAIHPHMSNIWSRRWQEPSGRLDLRAYGVFVFGK